MQGTVKWFNPVKGFGFITPEEGWNDIFVHITALNGLKVYEGDVISYDLVDWRKGQEASNVAMVTRNPNPVQRSFRPRAEGDSYHGAHQDEDFAQAA